MKKEQTHAGTRIGTHEEYSPYHPSYREGKWEKITLIRSTLIVCITVLTAAAMVVIYVNSHNKYTLSNSKNGVFIFDRSTGITNYCDMTGCMGISNGFIKPNKYAFSYQPGNALQQYMGSPYMRYPYAGSYYGWGGDYYQGQGGHSYPYGHTYPYRGSFYGGMPYGGDWRAQAPYYPYYAPPPQMEQPMLPQPQQRREAAVNPQLTAPAALQRPAKYRLVQDEDMGAMVSSPEDRGEEVPPAVITAPPTPPKAEEPAKETETTKEETTTTEESSTEETPEATVDGGLEASASESATEETQGETATEESKEETATEESASSGGEEESSATETDTTETESSDESSATE